jgi:hypothetical protein
LAWKKRFNAGWPSAYGPGGLKETVFTITAGSVLCYAAEVIGMMKKGEQVTRAVKVLRKLDQGVLKVNCDVSLFGQ